MPQRIDSFARLRAPPQLSETEAHVFGELIASVRPGHFELGDCALLVEFSRLTILVGELWAKYRTSDDPDALKDLCAAEKSLFSCCRLLRLSPSSRAPNIPSHAAEGRRRSEAHARRSTGSSYDQLEAMEATNGNGA
jgi:hypothetical protein